MFYLTQLIVLCIICISLTLEQDIYHNQWAVRVPGGEQEARLVAGQHGLNYLGSIGSLEDLYLLEDHRIVKRSTKMSQNHHNLLSDDPKIVWFHQQIEKKRIMRNSTHQLSLPTDPQFRFEVERKDILFKSILYQITMAFKWRRCGRQ